jgi:hypothetical protein
MNKKIRTIVGSLAVAAIAVASATALRADIIPITLSGTSTVFGSSSTTTYVAEDSSFIGAGQTAGSGGNLGYISDSTALNNEINRLIGLGSFVPAEAPITANGWISPPNGSGAAEVSVPLADQYSSASWPSGFYLTAFNLTSTQNVTLTSGQFEADNNGYIYLNGVLLAGPQTGNASVPSVTFNAPPSDFVVGTNYLVLVDWNNSGPSGVEYSATINTPSNPNIHVTTPEPGSLFLFGSGLVGLAGMMRRKVARRS